MAGWRLWAGGCAERACAMSSRWRKSPKVVLERKARFLGRFISAGFDESARSRLRAHVRLSKGGRTRLRLTAEGLGSGYRTGGVLRAREPYEFTPTPDIHRLVPDDRYEDVLLCVTRLADARLEIVAYRMRHATDALLFHDTFDVIREQWARGRRDDHTAGHMPVYELVGYTARSADTAPKAQRKHDSNWSFDVDSPTKYVSSPVPGKGSMHNWRGASPAVSSRNNYNVLAKHEAHYAQNTMSSFETKPSIVALPKRPNATENVKNEKNEVTFCGEGFDDKLIDNRNAVVVDISESTVCIHEEIDLLSKQINRLQDMLVVKNRCKNTARPLSNVVNTRLATDSDASLNTMQKTKLHANLNKEPGAVRVLVGDYREQSPGVPRRAPPSDQPGIGDNRGRSRTAKNCIKLLRTDFESGVGAAAPRRRRSLHTARDDEDEWAQLKAYRPRRTRSNESHYRLRPLADNDAATSPADCRSVGGAGLSSGGSVQPPLYIVVG